jgi:hypothetical protein
MLYSKYWNARSNNIQLIYNSVFTIFSNATLVGSAEMSATVLQQPVSMNNMV